MVNIDPDGGGLAPEVMKACARANGNNAGVYCEVLRTGRLAVGQAVFLRR
jgi:MOSC domain-containing protein YiiM